MKHIKLFEQYIKEAKFEFGNKFLADDTWEDKMLLTSWAQFIERMYAPNFEPNTEDEDELMRQMIRYFDENEAGQKELGKILKDVLPLKNKFPALLDPAQFDEQISDYPDWAKGYEHCAWRSTAISKKEINKFLQYSRLVFKTPVDMCIVVDNPNTVYRSRGNYGFLSFTVDPKIATNFNAGISDKGMTVRYGVDLKNPNFLLNPKVADTLSNFKEREVFYVGSSFNPDVMVIQFKDLNAAFVAELRKRFTKEPTSLEINMVFDQWKREFKL
jgi:hypothetical protein